jgi:hypothetical protein
MHLGRDAHLIIESIMKGNNNLIDKATKIGIHEVNFDVFNLAGWFCFISWILLLRK